MVTTVTMVLPGIFIWGYSSGGLEVPQCMVQGRSLGLGSGGRSPQKPKQFADIVYRFWLQWRSKFENFAQYSPPDSWPVCFTVGAKRHCWGLIPSQPMPGAPAGQRSVEGRNLTAGSD